MNYTNEKPSTPGWYSWRLSSAGESPAKLSERAIRVIVEGGEPFELIDGVSRALPAGGEFAGPFATLEPAVPEVPTLAGTGGAESDALEIFRNMDDAFPPDLSAAMRMAAMGRLLDSPSSTGWQPIETAPRDGRKIIVGVDIASVWIVRGAYWVPANEWGTTGPRGTDGWWSPKTSMTEERLEGVSAPSHWIQMPPRPL